MRIRSMTALLRSALVLLLLAIAVPALADVPVAEPAAEAPATLAEAPADASGEAAEEAVEPTFD